jgi:hypothetical protein
VIYHLLFGTHPFQGCWLGPGDPPNPSELIRQGYWPYATNSLIQPSQLTIPLDILNPELQHSFQRCFNEGHYITPLASLLRQVRWQILPLRSCSGIGFSQLVDGTSAGDYNFFSGLAGALFGAFTVPFVFFSTTYWWLCWSLPELTEFLFKLTFYCGAISGFFGRSLCPGLGGVLSLFAGAGIGLYSVLKLPKK